MRNWGWEELQSAVFYSAIVGSRAWGLAGEGSDEDVRGVFLWPFEAHNGLHKAPFEIRDSGRDAQYWEIERLIALGLRADPNVLDLLWSPLTVVQTERHLRVHLRNRRFPGLCRSLGSVRRRIGGPLV